MCLKLIQKAATLTDTTDTITIGVVPFGVIKKVQVKASASTDIWIYCAASGGNNPQLNAEDIVGATGSKITVNTTLTMYPLIATVTGNNSATNPLNYKEQIVSGTIKMDTANGAAADTITVQIWYDDDEAGGH